MKLLDIPIIRRIRQNHALEHATIHILSWRYPHLKLVGRSSESGFYVYGDVDTEAVAAAASEALVRLQRGEKELAVHPRCGTNLATAGILAGFSAFLALAGKSKRRWTRLPEALTLATIAVMLAQPLGLIIQRYLTTLPEVDDVAIKEVRRFERGGVRVHKVELVRR
ncbi:MAG: hypothetical protein DRI61_06470 [Chloroflexi bacterium]|nr:MAG: hypothetical protein DRI61_06470 [Chloroflexota bacterium]